MIPATTLRVSGERFLATYVLTGPVDLARSRAQSICVEQTIEFPADLVADDDIRGQVIGRVESLEQTGPETVAVRISYAVETTGFELGQLLNVLFGNCSILPGVRLTGLELAPSLLRAFPGPRFGVPGLRRLLDAPDRPILATALKPMGLSPEVLADIAATMARAGIDVIKDDHGLANQPFAPWEARVRACAAAVAKVNAETGRHALYMPSLNAPISELHERARIARAAGAGGLLVLPGLTGMDSIRWMASDEAIGLPIMGHPAYLGANVTSPVAGIEHGLLFGTLYRLAGADLTVFPTYGGRFSFTREECRSIADACRRPMGSLPAILPTPGGGMTLDRVAEIRDFYGPDTAILVGGDLHRGDLARNIEAMRLAVSGAVTAAMAAGEDAPS